jgi:hypothetical protein
VILEMSVAKLFSPGQYRNAQEHRCPEAGGSWIVDDTQSATDSPSQPQSDDTESVPDGADSIVPIATTAAPTLPAPTNGASPKRIAANRRNAQKSTGPKTSHGKAMSSWNSTRHGLLSNRLPLLYGRSKKRFNRLLRSLQQDLEPVGALEEVLVEKIAQEYWRLGVAAWYEAEDFTQAGPFKRTSIDRILRYQTTTNRQLFQAMNQLERLQRLRKGENVPAPLTVQVSGDTPTISDHENSE